MPHLSHTHIACATSVHGNHASTHRDLSLRLVAAMMGYGTMALPGPNGEMFVYILGPCFGALIGALVHDLAIAPGLRCVSFVGGVNIATVSDTACEPLPSQPTFSSSIALPSTTGAMPSPTTFTRRPPTTSSARAPSACSRRCVVLWAWTPSRAGAATPRPSVPRMSHTLEVLRPKT
jgi:hypothetical protein